MKTIEISEEDYEFLKECKNLLNTQDDRSTANPIYCIQDIHKEYGKDSMHSFDGYIILDKNSSDNVFYTKEEFLDNYTLDDGCDFDNETIYAIGIEDDEDHEFEKIYYSEIWKIEEGATFSFFEKDAVEHLKSNYYHYSDKARTYACSSWRSPLMNRLRELLMKIEI